MTTLTGVILAIAPDQDELAHDLYGRSRFALPLAGLPLATRALHSLYAAGVGDVLAVASAATAADVRRALGPGVAVVQAGPGAGLVDALALAREHLPAGPTLVHAGDAFGSGPAALSAERLAAPVAAGLRAAGHDIERHMSSGWRYEGTTRSLLEGNRLALDDVVSSVRGAGPPGAGVEGRVDIHPTAVLERVVVRGPAVIGPHAVLANAFVGPYTTIGAGVRIEGAEVEHSLILPGATLRHLDRRVESSVIGRDARVVCELSVPAGLRLRVGRGAEVVLG